MELRCILWLHITYHHISLHTSHTLHTLHIITYAVCESYCKVFCVTEFCHFARNCGATKRGAEAPGLSALARNHRSPRSQVARKFHPGQGNFVGKPWENPRETIGKMVRKHHETWWFWLFQWLFWWWNHGETHHFHHPKDLPQTPANDHPPCRVSVGILVSGDGCSTGFYGNFIGEKRGNLHGGVLKWRYP